jgi:predicted alpha/beta hydrolase family esterase
MPKYSFEESVEIAQGIIDRDMPDVIVGSSRGGAIAMCVDPGYAKLVLVAPAWKHFMQTASKKVSDTAMILHSAADKIVKYEDSQHLAETCKATLITVGTCHRMSDDDALEAILDAVKWCSNESR